jgi:hypothetical protein
MCDFYSWIEKDGKLFYLDDKTIETHWPKDDVREHIGHAAIEAIYPEAIGGQHRENAIEIPPQIAKEINRGHMNKMAKAGGWNGARYTSRGHLCSPWWKNAEQFIEAIKQTQWLDNHGKIKKEWKIFETRGAAGDAARAAARGAAGDAAWVAARDAAGVAARAAAWVAARDAAGDAAWVAARAAARVAARDAAGDAARAAARDAAPYAARGAAGDAARDAALCAAPYAALCAAGDAADAARAAARDAALYARCLISDPGLPHSKHATDRLDVWLRGYGLLCDVNGILYVYKKIN